MKITRISLALTPLLSSALLLVGCTTPGKNMIPQGGSMTMSQIYQSETGQHEDSNDQHQSQLQGIRSDIIGPLPKVNYTAYTANSVNQVNNLFKALPNPEIAMYIYPHLVHANGEAYPKPGISTAFFLYDRNHFAMPNEVY